MKRQRRTLSLTAELIATVERTLGQQRQFLADTSHELRSPLTVVLANLKKELALAPTLVNGPDAAAKQRLVAELDQLLQRANDLNANESNLNGTIATVLTDVQALVRHFAATDAFTAEQQAQFNLDARRASSAHRLRASQAHAVERHPGRH